MGGSKDCSSCFGRGYRLLYLEAEVRVIDGVSGWKRHVLFLAHNLTERPRERPSIKSSTRQRMERSNV
eukprot:scaffold5698_cov158-Ochromonas_danica.AAC.6